MAPRPLYPADKHVVLIATRRTHTQENRTQRRNGQLRRTRGGREETTDRERSVPLDGSRATAGPRCDTPRRVYRLVGSSSGPGIPDPAAIGRPVIGFPRADRPFPPVRVPRYFRITGHRTIRFPARYQPRRGSRIYAGSIISGGRVSLRTIASQGCDRTTRMPVPSSVVRDGAISSSIASRNRSRLDGWIVDE